MPFLEAMAMGKLHKEIGHFILQAAEDPDYTDAQVIKVSCDKGGHLIMSHETSIL